MNNNARGVYSIPMAEWAMFRVLEHYKQGWFFRMEQENGRWTKHRGLREVAGIKVAVVGAGNVGQIVAKHFQAFEQKLQVLTFIPTRLLASTIWL